jgi:20S proteasome alpha/beta subunit
MTILVGILCKDGAVIGADSTVSLGPSPAYTIEQVAPKIGVVGGRVIVAGTGSIGHGQRFVELLDEAVSGDALKLSSLDFSRCLSQMARADFASTRSPEGCYGALVAFPAGGAVHLCEFAVADFQPELRSQHLWYGSMGSGQPIVDPFLGLLRRVFWRDGPPSCSSAIFAVTWALRHVLELNTGGIGGPLSIAVLRSERRAEPPRARILTQEEIGEHEANVRGLEDHIHRYAAEQRGDVEIPGARAVPI